MSQLHDIIQRLFHRTLEVWGSIPHGSTQENKDAAQRCAVLLFPERDARPFRRLRNAWTRNLQELQCDSRGYV